MTRGQIQDYIKELIAAGNTTQGQVKSNVETWLVTNQVSAEDQILILNDLDSYSEYKNLQSS